MIPTLLGIMVVNFVIVQAAPGGPVDVMIARSRGQGSEATARISGSGSGEVTSGRGAEPPRTSGEARYRGARGIDPDLIRQLEKQYGFDRPARERFLLMMRNYLRFDFGQSFF